MSGRYTGFIDTTAPTGRQDGICVSSTSPAAAGAPNDPH
jgi:hypothetical protein